MMDLIETTPKMDLAIHDIEHLVEELHAYHAIDNPLFQRREQREAAPSYLQGLLATLPRKSIEPMVLAVDGVAPKAVRAMQSFISEGQWNDERLLHQHWKEVGVSHLLHTRELNKLGTFLYKIRNVAGEVLHRLIDLNVVLPSGWRPDAIMVFLQPAQQPHP